MSRKIIILSLVIALTTSLVLLFFGDGFIGWLRFQWLDIIYAFLLAMIAGLVMEYIYKKYLTKSKMLRTTATYPSKNHKCIAKLVLEDSQELSIEDHERTFGREDFLGVLLPDDLLFIGEEHFRITRMDDGCYIEDLDTKNGTKINGEEIKGQEKIRLEDEDEILVAKTLPIKYLEE